MTTESARPHPRPRERGLALAIALFVVTALLMSGSSALLVGASDVRATRNYRGASQAHFVAESAVAHAMQVVNGPGVVNFNNEVVNQWGTVFGTSARRFDPLPGYSYSVTALPDTVDTANWGRFLATSTGPEGERNVVVARVQRTDTPRTAPGAVYLAQDTPTNATFNGTAWQIDGNDKNYTGGDGPGADVPGLSTRNDSNTQEAINSLTDNQKPHVTGLGYQAGPPVIPSVMTSGWAPSVAQLNQIATDILALPGVVHDDSSQIAGNVTFGTPDDPEIRHFTQSVTIKGAGTVQGAGIMIVDGDLTIKGELQFKGLIIVRGKTAVVGDVIYNDDDSETEVTGRATLYGSLWTNDINLVVGGSAIVQYSTQALMLANQVADLTAALPTPVRLVSLADCALVPSGSGGCP